jgi:hypothetical protein
MFNMSKSYMFAIMIVLLLVSASKNAEGSSSRRRRPRFSTVYAAQVQERLLWECAVADPVMTRDGDGMVAAAAAAQGGVEPARVFAASSAMATTGVQVGHVEPVEVF